MRRRAFVRLLAVTPFAPSAPIWRRLGLTGAIAAQAGAPSQVRQDIPALKVVSSYAPAKTPGMPGPYPGRVVSVKSDKSVDVVNGPGERHRRPRDDGERHARADRCEHDA